MQILWTNVALDGILRVSRCSISALNIHSRVEIKIRMQATNFPRTQSGTTENSSRTVIPNEHDGRWKEVRKITRYKSESITRIVQGSI